MHAWTQQAWSLIEPVSIARTFASIGLRQRLPPEEALAAAASE